ncbi:hypothetical protein Bca52824_033749 [Brassica carinata]|uniref:non-specific serine/threonine protein kinase n=1 Tax=Brassica carinata TaxID=52824 RepID=A0A8X7SF48_BRACI|nr:hypothetical protein Bca52824_033749 [Brassica carinata]
MKFKKLKRLFSSSKKVESDNSPANSPSETDKKKPRPNPKEETRRPNRIFGFVAVLKEFTKKHCKRASSDQVSLRSYLSFSCSNGRKLRAETSNLASSLGSNRIKSRSLRVTLETCFRFRKDKATPVVRSHDLPELITRQDSADKSKVSPPSDSGTPENPKELKPPHLQAIPQMARTPRKSLFGDNKSFSHELNAEGVRPFPLRKPDRSNSWEEVLNQIKAKFNKAKEEVNVDLKQLSEDLVRISKDNAKSHHELKVIIGDLIILTEKCINATSEKFWLHCERIVQELDDKRQELPPGVPKQLHTRLLFILTRCSRLLQFRKESWGHGEEFAQQSQSRPLSSPYNETSWNILPSLVSKGVKEAAVSKAKNDSQSKVVEIQVATNKSKVSPPSDSGTPEVQSKGAKTPSSSSHTSNGQDSKKEPFGDNKSFSHELNAEGVRPFPLRKPDRSNSWEEVLNQIKAKFNKAKEEVNVDLKQLSEDLVRISKDNAKSHHELKVIIGDLIILTEKCINATSEKFWLHCERIVQELDDKRQELPPGVPKQLHTRLLFILTRCSRLLQFRKESWGHGEEFAQQSQSRPLSSPYNETSWNILPSLVSKGVKEAAVSKAKNDSQSKVVEIQVATSDDMSIIIDKKSIICRICEEDVPTTHLEDHSKICELADIYDLKGVSVDARLLEVALTLDNIIEIFRLTALKSRMRISRASLTRVSDLLSAKLSDCSQRGSEDMLDCFGPKSDQGMTTSSASIMTPRRPRPDLFELLFRIKVTFHDRDDIPLMTELANIARRAANAISDDDQSMKVLLSCLHDLRVTIDGRKFDALTVETFGTRIEKLIRDKYLKLNEILDDEKVDLSSTVIDEGVLLEDDVDQRSLRTRSVHLRDRISIDDFEEIKEISRGAYGRVLLAKKRTTGDIFAIKVLKKSDMIRKNAVERILAERDILINVHNPFVVRFFYSFTCRENLYLVMEYVNGGDFFSLLKGIGCLEEPVARVYIAEVVLALEYLHSEGVVHRDLKPDNLLMAHDGHVKLTDFGLSEVGLIDSTGDLSGPVLSEEKPKLQTSEHKFERRSARGTPDYLAPEILLGTGHGATADWWSVGIILFEFIVGVPPFNADNPEQIFDNILDRKIPWPSIPEEMTYEARDLIDRLLTKDPHQRLGARGAAEVKQHIFFKDINWDTLPEQKATFVPDTEDALDTSYFQSRYASDKRSSPTNENGKSCESGSSGCLSNDHNDGVDELGGPAELETNVSENNPFDNFSYKFRSSLKSIHRLNASFIDLQNPPSIDYELVCSASTQFKLKTVIYLFCYGK